MMYMLVRNTVRDFDAWKQVFDEEMQTGVPAEAGLRLAHLYRELDEPNAVHFVLSVSDKAKAHAYVQDPRSAAIGERAGVIDGQLTYVESIG